MKFGAFGWSPARPASRTRRAPWQSRAGAAHGLTLLELITWFGIFLITSAVSTPSLVRLVDAYNLHGATRRVYAELQSLRTAAVATNTRHRSVLDGGVLRLGRFDLEAGQWQDLGASAPVVESVSVAATGDIVFAPNGTAPSSGAITLTNANGTQKTIVVSSAGLVRIH